MIDFELVPLTHPWESATDKIPLVDFLNTSATVPEIGLDTEGNGKNVRDGTGWATGVSISYQGTDGPIYHYMPFRHKYGPNLPKEYLWQLKEVLDFRTANELPWISHNSLYDMAALRTLGIGVTRSKHYCTLLMAALIDEIQPFSKRLNSCVAYYQVGDPKRKSDALDAFIETFGWDAVPSEMMYEYGAYDAELHRLLKVKLESRWAAEKLEQYWINHKMPTLSVWNEMMTRGVKIDTALCEKMIAIGEESMEDVREILQLNPGSPNDLHELLINQLGLPIVKWTDGGKKRVPKPSFDKQAMQQYDEMLEERDDDTARLVLQYRGWQKSVSSNYKSYLSHLSPDGKLRCNYLLHRTKTLRASCEEPNLQQIPKTSLQPWNGEMKKCFIGDDEEWVLIEGDYSQLEFRLGTYYGQDEKLLEVFANDDLDLFEIMAADIGLPRQKTKTLVYATGYGAGPEKLKNSLGISLSRAIEARSNYFAAYPGLRNASNLCAATAKVCKKVKLWSGRYRHFDHFSQSTHKAFNSVCQGGGADIVEGAMRRLEYTICDENCKLLLQIHDSCVLMVRKSLLHIYMPEIKRAMEDVEPIFGIRFKVDVHIWGEG